MLRRGRAGEIAAHVPPDEVDEVRIVATYLASHPELPQLPLEPEPTPGGVKTFLSRSAERQLDDAALAAAPDRNG